MAVADTITSIRTHVEDAYGSIEEKGGTIPTDKNIENLSTAIDSIEGGGGDISEYLMDTLTSDASSSGYAAVRLIKKIPLLIFTGSRSLAYVFKFCSNLTEVVSIQNTSTSTTTNSMFNYCSKLTAVPLFDTSKITTMGNMFAYCGELTTIPKFDTRMCTSFGSMFSGCTKLISIPEIDVSSGSLFSYMFSECSSLTAVPLFDMGNATDIANIVSNCNSLSDLGGFKDLGKAYSTTQSAHYAYYRLIIPSGRVTEQSLINVLTKLYDIATAGVQTQDCRLGATNLAKLTSPEGQQALIDAQNKGWTIS